MNLLPTLRLYLTFMRTAFLTMLAYRLRYYTGIFTYLVFVSVYYFIWEAVYSGVARGSTINGFTFPEMVTYVAIGWIARSFYHSNIDDDMNDIVESGRIGVFLLRPVNFQLMMIFQAMGESCFRLLLFSLPISLVICTVYPVHPPPDGFSLLCFILSTVLGFFVLALVNFLVGLLAFSLKSIQGVLRAKQNLIQLLSGLMLPLTFFPVWAQSALDLLPFKAISYTPLRFYLGKIPPSAALPMFAEQLGWILSLYLLGAYCWSRATKQLTVQGG